MCECGGEKFKLTKIRENEWQNELERREIQTNRQKKAWKRARWAQINKPELDGGKETKSAKTRLGNELERGKGNAHLLL
jgi:hypothetical protein